jgi:hypothetical protein
MNLVLLYPDYLYRGDLYANTTAKSGFPATNVITGTRQLYYKSNVAGAGVSFDIDVSALPASERACQYVYVGGFNLAVATIGQASVVCEGASNSAISTAVTAFSLSDRKRDDLYGIAKEDFVIENPTPLERNYWRVSITKGAASGNHIFCVRQIMLGRWWYAGREPDPTLSIKQARIYGRREVRSLNVSWSGVTNNNLEIFTNRIARHSEYSNVVLYTRNNHSILNGERVFNAKLESFTIDRTRHNSNKITCDFLEII